ncbi:patellin-6 [Selaginella moellendorffii]|nr:patellin-6 [Selaginella moellendorffii]XP_024542120.1 patellin-6 [Selaginella moellendorffii]|eukprot:XP_002981400.2 patellin-6 [Selaginella moellendorffii]
MALECQRAATLPERMRMEEEKARSSESYIIAELGEAEQQALADFKLAIAAAAKAGEFSIPSAGNAGATEQGDDPPPAAAPAGIDSADSGITLWGIPLLDGSGAADVVMLKFLRAREFKVDTAVEMLKNTVSWRKRFGCDRGFLGEEIEAGIKSTGFYYGCDRGGHPVCYNIVDSGMYQELLDGQDGFEKLLRWRVKLMEDGIKLLDFDPRGVSSMVQVIDLKNFSMKKKARAALLDTIQLFSDNYPELVSKLMLVNVPWYYNALYVMISPFLTQRSKDKISVATKRKTPEALFAAISPENVPVQYGGLGKANDELFRNAKATITESCVKAGSMLIIEIQINEGDEVSWELSVLGWDVSYGAEFTPSTEGGYTVIVEKPRKISAQEFQGEGELVGNDGICNTFKTKSPGSLLLTIDNSAAKKKKLVHYRYIVRG